jgi:motility quorum-sensing regulator/GCU-specific mRNA interferase toxin
MPRQVDLAPMSDRLDDTPSWCYMSEKRRPTYDLREIQRAFRTPSRLSATATALRSAAALGFGREEIVETIQRLERRHFYKSMTSYRNSRLWQDIYHAPSAVGTLYVKFVEDAVSEFRLLSFKEKDDE